MSVRRIRPRPGPPRTYAASLAGGGEGSDGNYDGPRAARKGSGGVLKCIYIYIYIHINMHTQRLYRREIKVKRGVRVISKRAAGTRRQGEKERRGRARKSGRARVRRERPSRLGAVGFPLNLKYYAVICDVHSYTERERERWRESERDVEKVRERKIDEESWRTREKERERECERE